MRRRWILILGLLLVGCGYTQRVYKQDGICYSHQRGWFIGITVDNRTDKIDAKNCP